MKVLDRDEGGSLVLAPFTKVMKLFRSQTLLKVTANLVNSRTLLDI